MKGVWGAVKGELKKFQSCMINAAKGAAKKAIMSKLPKSAGSLMGMLGVRRLGMFNKLKKAAKKAGKSMANKAKGAACKAFGGKALGMCKQAVKAGVNKAADALKKKVPKLNPSLAKPC